MIRIGLIELSLFLTPFVLYAAFLFVTRSGTFDPASWPVRHLYALAAAALVLVLAGLVYLAHFSGAPIGADYVPAHLENGRLVPGTYK